MQEERGRIPSVNERRFEWRRLLTLPALSVGVRRRKPAEAPFEHLLKLSHQVASMNPVALHELIRLCLRPLQTQLLISAAARPAHEARQPVGDSTFFSETSSPNLWNTWGQPKHRADEYEIHLARDPILPCPWNRRGYASALANIGLGKACGAWKQDSTNHRISVWLEPAQLREILAARDHTHTPGLYFALLSGSAATVVNYMAGLRRVLTSQQEITHFIETVGLEMQHDLEHALRHVDEKVRAAFASGLRNLEQDARECGFLEREAARQGLARAGGVA